MRKPTNPNNKKWRAGALLLAGFFTLPAMADYSSTVQSFSPLGYWRFNETVASPAMNVAANSGSVGVAGQGYVVGNVTKGFSGRVGTAMHLNNSGTIGSILGKVDVPYNASLNPKSPWSVEFWCMPTADGVNDTTGYCMMSNFDPNGFGGGNRSGWLFYMIPTASAANPGRITLRFGLTSGYAVVLDATNNPCTISNWTHVAATFDGTTVRLYLNGGISGASPVSSAWEPNTKMALRFGGTPLTGTESDGPGISNTGISGNRGFPGALDEVAFYGSVLSASTVAAHYAAATTNNAGYGAQILAGTPLAYWPMDDAAVATPPDSAYPTAANSGSATAATATNWWGTLANQDGPDGAGFGAGNKCVFFNGETGFSDVAEDAALHFSGNITMMAWVKIASQDFFRNILAHGWDGDYAETFLRISRASGGDFYGDNFNTYYEVGRSDGDTYTALYFQIPKGDIGQWVQVAGTYDGTSWNLYRNGELVSTGVSANGAFDVTNRWCIGSRSRDESGGGSPIYDGLFFGGSIDEPAIFNTALSAANIKTLYDEAQMKPYFPRPLAAQSGTLFATDTIVNDFWAQGSGTLTYLWLSNGVVIPGATATNISFAANTAGPLTLSAVAQNAYGSATNSVTYTILTPTAASITTQPISFSRYVGYPFILSVVASGSPTLKYQWYAGGVPIGGATASSYSSTVGGSTVGYTCVVSNNYGTPVTSVVATVTSLPLPTGIGSFAQSVLTNTPKPLAYYRLDETSGAVARDLVGGRDGVYNNATLNQPGYAPAADSDPSASFGAVNSYVGISSGCFTWTTTTHTNFTIECWVNGPAGQGDESTVLARGIGSTGTTRTEQFALDVSGGTYRFFTTGGGNSIYECLADVGPNGNWQHIVCVYDDLGSNGPTANMTIYVNGEQRGSGSARPPGVRPSNDPFAIGAKRLGNNPAYDGFFTGSIDEVAFYGYAMSAETVASHYGQTYGPAQPPVITIQPKNKTNYVGLPITLSVDAYGSSPLTYQWKKGGVDVSGANSNTFAIDQAALSDIGTYSVGITNGVNPGVLSGSATISVLALPTSDVAIPGLVLHLPFDSNLTDATGRGNNGAAVLLVTNVSGPLLSNVGPSYALFDSNSKIGSSSLQFQTIDTSFGSGASWSNSYVSLNNKADLRFSSNANFSLSFWIKYVSVPGVGTGFGADFGDLPYLCTGVGSTFATPGLVFAYSYGTGATPWIGAWAFSVYDTAGNGLGGRGTQGTIDDGEWHHLVHVFDHKTGSVTYLDGKVAKFNKQAGTAFYNAQNVDSGQWFTIGQDPTGLYGEVGSGAMDDLGIWKRALTPLEAASLYAAGIGGFSFQGAPFSLGFSRSGSSITLSWDVGVLQQASDVNGPYTDVGSLSPLTVTPSSPKFYRIRL